MISFDDLNDENFLLFAAKSYNSPHCVQSEFKEDLSRIRYVRRGIRSYLKTGELKYRQIMNHIIILYNVFGLNATRMLFFQMTLDEWKVLKTFLLFLNFMPEVVRGINGKDIISSDIIIDIETAKILRGI